MHLNYKRGPSAHFSWSEVNPHGFSGFSPFIRVKAIRHARNIEKLRTAINAARKIHKLPPTGLHILSWWRPRWYNEKIGGATNSQHIYGDATDISRQEVDRLCPWKGGRADFDRIASRIFSGGGFGQYPAGSRHVDSRGYRARWSSW